MKPTDFDQTLAEILRKDPRYHRQAYFFVREALDHVQKPLTKGRKIEDYHVTGQELINGIREFALAQFGPMALTVLNEWGVHRCEDFGELVFNMVESQLLSKTEQDSRDDFKGGYNFDDAFRKPFLPPSKQAAVPSSIPVVKPKAH